MSTNDIFSIPIAKLELELMWNEKRLKKVFPYENSQEINHDIFGKESRSFWKILGLICILFLSVMSLAFIPFENVVHSLEEGNSDVIDFFILVLNSVYIYWLISTVSKRYTQNIDGNISKFRIITFFRTFFCHNKTSSVHLNELF